MEPFKIYNPTAPEVPIVVSVPHCGIAFPDDIKREYVSSLIQAPDDTDWFVDKLYDFAPALGMTLITANYSRWVIDLNRDPDSKPLYSDGRIITALCPTTTFLGEPLYTDKREAVDDHEVKRRYELYYRPYHEKIQALLNEKKAKFGRVLLWDCHSIRQMVPTIQKDKFPDLILGDADERSASPELIKTTIDTLSSSSLKVSHNHPFKGGTITRTFGKPDENQHALQLEMPKVNYMDDSETRYDEARANQMRSLLKKTFDQLITRLC
ncbi:MAG TPA: N-formylglutamate amidohydrolase [Ohtaekwangia sp.]|uniref:N-formylglutamate amidohydrolase n=1 Tax=Ohtaekwangia sp. TaxID=2066019 RepID=UPI002F93B4BB